jgi:hypothetical protein
MKARLDRRGEDAEDLAIEEVEDVGQQQEQQDAVGDRARLLLRCRAQKFTPIETQSCRGAPSKAVRTPVRPSVGDNCAGVVAGVPAALFWMNSPVHGFCSRKL